MKNMHFKEEGLSELNWGINVLEFKQTFPFAESCFEAMPNIYQMPFIKIHKHIGPLTIHFNEFGLYMVCISYIFKENQKHFSQKDVVMISDEILNSLLIHYGEPLVIAPWDENIKKFNYIWIFNSTLIQYAWDGENAWAIHYRSIKLDNAARLVLKEISEYLS